MFLGIYAKFREEAVSFVISVFPSVRMEQLGFHWKNFHEIFRFIIFRK